MRQWAVVAAGVLALAVGVLGAKPASPKAPARLFRRYKTRRDPSNLKYSTFRNARVQPFSSKGADGNLWFSNIGRHEIARFDIGLRQLRTFRLHPTSQVLVMSNGPDRSEGLEGMRIQTMTALRPSQASV